MSDATPTDRATDIRPGEQLDLERLRPYLERELGEPMAGLEVKQFPGGHSNLTYLLRVGARELVLRRPPFGSKVKTAHDMTREYRVLDKLSAHRAWAPKPLLLCEDHEVMGADFYVMERIAGVIVRRQLPKGVSVDEPTARRLCETLLDTLVELHALDYQVIGLGDLGKPEGYVERQVTGWSKRYEASQTDDIPAMPRLSAWLAANMPTSPAPCIIHNDYKFDNVIYDSTAFERIVGVLDWEMATVGDPLMDLGTMLCYWVEAGDHDGLKNLSFGPTMLPGMYTRRALAERYADETGRPIDDILFYFVFGLFKTAVVLQQIYYRWKQGLTKDPRFGALIVGVQLLAQAGDAALERGRL
ncbi:MAG: phosphotransferase family protein [Myxococcales bacterium]|nr:phosphotransferase family protein [Myxococcales bacterium]